MRSGFVAVLGRPNVGKSTLVNRMVGSNVTITSSRPNTTRLAVRGVLHRPEAQVVFVDTPGVHRSRSALGERMNDLAASSAQDVDVVLVVVDATAAIGPGDRAALARAVAVRSGPESTALMVVVNKIDRAAPAQVLERLAGAAQAVEELGAELGVDPGAEYFPVSARSAEGVDVLVDAIVERLPEGPAYFPTEMVTDLPEAVRVAELVREQLLMRARDELPHSIACRVTEWEWPVVRCEILVERPSQKAIVIGRGGEVLKAVGTEVRRSLPPGTYLELFVRVERRWPQREEMLDRLGYRA
jgi:GTP-binding protein Era